MYVDFKRKSAAPHIQYNGYYQKKKKRESEREERKEGGKKERKKITSVLARIWGNYNPRAQLWEYKVT